MHVKIQQFLRQNHSWAHVGWNIGRTLIKLGHEIDLYPSDTDKIDYSPADLKPYIKTQPPQGFPYQACISYTAPHNFPKYLNGKNKFGIWCYEFPNAVPRSMIKWHTFTDFILPPSQFAKDILVRGGFPKDKLVVVPHGIHLLDYENKDKYPLKTEKRFKILVNVAQCHLRKNLPAIFEAFGKAFNNTDDVCLVIKTVPKREGPPQQFDVDFYSILKDFKKQYPKHADLEIITDFIDNLIPLYNSCDVLFTMSHTECFYMPGLEILGANKINICPRYGGQLDFLNDNNGLLIDTKIGRADKKALYWDASSSLAEWGNPSVEHAALLLQRAYKEYDILIQQFSPNIKETIEKFTWDNSVSNILKLCV